MEIIALICEEDSLVGDMASWVGEVMRWGLSWRKFFVFCLE